MALKFVIKTPKISSNSIISHYEHRINIRCDASSKKKKKNTLRHKSSAIGEKLAKPRNTMVIFTKRRDK